MLSSILSTALFAIAAIASPLPDASPDATPQGFEQMGKLSTALAVRHDSSPKLGKRDNWNIIRNELSECKPVTVIFARGTIELGNVGSITGPPFFNALDAVLGEGNVGVQGVDYPADILGYLEGGDTGGASTMAGLLNQAASQCPNTQIILSGYSQGAQVAHLAEDQISADVAAKIAAVVSDIQSQSGDEIANVLKGRIW